MLYSTKILAILCSILVPLGCVADTGDSAESNRALQAEFEDELEDDEPGVQDRQSPAAYVTGATCGPEVHIGEGADWLMDMTVEELVTASSGYLSVAPLRSSSDDASECHAEVVVDVRVAEGVALHTNISSLCVDDRASNDEIVLRTCADGEVSLGSRSTSSLTDQADPVAAECWFCTADSCINNGWYDQKKKGNIYSCPFNWGTDCCWASNNGCCY